MSGISARGCSLCRAALILLVFTFGACAVPGLAETKGELLSDIPQRAASTTQFEARTSTIAPSIDVPYNALREAANAAADAFAGPASGRTPTGCHDVDFGCSS